MLNYDNEQIIKHVHSVIAIFVHFLFAILLPISLRFFFSFSSFSFYLAFTPLFKCSRFHILYGYIEKCSLMILPIQLVSNV